MSAPAIFDLTGKRMISRTLPVIDGSTDRVVGLNGALGSGLYLVTVTAGGEHYTERLVVEP